MALVAVSREDRLDLAFEVNPSLRPCPRGAPFLRRRAGNRRSHSVNDDRQEKNTDRAFEDSTHTSPAGMMFIAVSISESDHKRVLVKPTFAAKIVHRSGRCKSGSVHVHGQFGSYLDNLRKNLTPLCPFRNDGACAVITKWTKWSLIVHEQ